MLAGFVASTFSDKHSFLLISLFMFTAVATGLGIFRGSKAKKFRQAEVGHKHKPKLSLLITIFKEFVKVHKHALPLYILSVCAYIWIAVEWAFVAIAGIERFGFTDVSMGIVLGAMMAVEGVLYYSAGYLMDKIGKRYIITAGFLLLFSSAYFMFLSTNPAMFVIFALLAAGAVSWILPGTEALLTEIMPANLYGEMSGLFDTSKDFGLVIGPLVGGFLATALENPSAAFLLVSIVAGIATLVAGWNFWPEKKVAKS